MRRDADTTGNGSEASARMTQARPENPAAVVADLRRVQALFQARAIAAVLGAPAPTTLSTPSEPVK